MTRARGSSSPPEAPEPSGLMLVSLFPGETWKNRPNGLRRDLAGLLADMRPSFVRFPGGCVVEGATLENRVQWKRTIGDIAGRPGHWNLWGYRATDGLGFHEFLQLCEDLDADPLYVINVGMSCQGRAGMVADPEQLKDYLQEALDALEYAMGPATSHWGALRAANGHPKPFVVRYVEIGNENGGPDYQRAYRFIQSGIKRAYPGVITIANERVMLTDQDRASYPGVSLEMIDEHYYQSPSFFYEQSTQYDTYDRSDSVGIYIGEFAVTAGGPGKGNLLAALGESAFMIGMERNADKVRMASYAPTFVNVNDRAWNPDMIVYDGSRSYGTPVVPRHQDVLAEPSRSRAADLSRLRRGHHRPPMGAPPRRHCAQCLEYRRRIQGREGREERPDPLCRRLLHGRRPLDATPGSLGGPQRGAQEQEHGCRGDGHGGRTGMVRLYPDAEGTEAERRGRLHRLRAEERGKPVHVEYRRMGKLHRCAHAGQSDLGRRREIRIETEKWYEIKIDVSGRRVRCFLDGVLRHDAAARETLSDDIRDLRDPGERRDDDRQGGESVREEKACDVSISGAGAIEPPAKRSS